MSPNGPQEGAGGARGEGAGGAGHTQGFGVDSVREMFLGLAAQIDAVAALIGGIDVGGDPAGRKAADDSFAAGAAGTVLTMVSTVAGSDGMAQAAGEFTSLLAELGELLARLLAALIAVLEALMHALQSSSGPEGAGTPTVRYEPIAVRFDAPEPGMTPAAPRGPDAEI